MNPGAFRILENLARVRRAIVGHHHDLIPLAMDGHYENTTDKSLTDLGR